MKRRMLSLIGVLVLLLTGLYVPSAMAGEHANPALADWTHPAFSYTTRGRQNPLNGYALPAEQLNTVMHVHETVGGWTYLQAPYSGDYSFSVDTDQLTVPSFSIRVYRVKDTRDMEQTDCLQYVRGSGIVTHVIHEVVQDELLYWWEDDDTGRGYTLTADFLLMVSAGDLSGTKADGASQAPASQTETPLAAVAEDDGLNGQPVLSGVPKTGDTFVMGRYEQDNNPANGRERIEWTVLSVNTKKDTVLVIASQALDCLLYHPSRVVIKWGDTSLRVWLNDSFAMASFTPEERSCILPTSADGVQDTVTILDESQIKKYKLAKNGCEVTPYARARGVNVAEDNGLGCWWVRCSKTKKGGWTKFVGRHGKVYWKNYTTSADNGVRPAMTLKLSALRSCLLAPDFAVLTGEAVDASNPNRKLSGVRVTVGSQTVTTGQSGQYVIPVDCGEYTISAEKEGYISVSAGMTVCQGGQITCNIPMSRIMADNEYRVVLTWGEHPRDLDSHLNGADENGGRYHVYYSALQADHGDALLEWDDTTSYGPETTHFLAYPGQTYVFSVHDYTNLSSYGNAMALSGARVVVYRGNQEIGTFTVPQADATVWHVFKVVNNELQVLNTTGFISNPSAVGQDVR